MTIRFTAAAFVVVMTALTSPLAQAQQTPASKDANTPAAAAAPVTREQRKADTAAANKAGKLTSAGEGGSVAPTPSTKSTMTKAERKAQTKSDQKAGQMLAAGEGARAPTSATKSTMTKAERKAQTVADQKAGKMAPAGEGAKN